MGVRGFLNQAMQAAYQTARLFRPRNVVARPASHAAQLLHEIVNRVVSPRRVELRGLDHEQRRGVVVKEEVVVGLVQLTHVLVVEGGRVAGGARALLEPAAEHVGRRLEVDHEIRRRDVVREQLVEPLIDEQLVVIEVEIRVNLVALEQVIADGGVREEVALPEQRLLAVAGERVEELCLERRAGTAAMEVGEERIVGFVEDDGGVQPRAQAIRERRFADACGPFNGEVTELHRSVEYKLSPVLRLERLQMRLVRLPLVHFFETSFGRTYDRTFVLVTVSDGDGEGLGECVADANPYYSAETTGTAWHVIKEFLAPLVLGRPFEHPREVFPAMRLVRGHQMAKAALEMAAWDLYARTQGVPLSQALGGTRDRIASGVSIGIQDSLEQLADKIALERDAGYRRIKI